MFFPVSPARSLQPRPMHTASCPPLHSPHPLTLTQAGCCRSFSIPTACSLNQVLGLHIIGWMQPQSTSHSSQLPGLSLFQLCSKQSSLLSLPPAPTLLQVSACLQAPDCTRSSPPGPTAPVCHSFPALPTILKSFIY
jgi:hypothetical protein